MTRRTKIIIILVAALCAVVGLGVRKLVRMRSSGARNAAIANLLQIEASSAAAPDDGATQKWLSSPRRTAGYDTNLSIPTKGLYKTFEHYKSKEKPGRSNYFNMLVFDLRAQLEKRSFSKEEIVTFFGVA